MGQGTGALETVRTGMMANEKALQTTSNNISNINTKGYSRQQIMLKSADYVDINGGRFQYGTGTLVQETRQVRNDFLDGIYREELKALGYWEKREKTFKALEGVIGEPMWEGLQNSTNQFWDAWQELSKDPTSLTTRSLVKQRGESLVEQVNDLGFEFKKMQEELDNELYNYVSDINTCTKRISELNFEILKAESTGDNANDFRDKRNLLVDKLIKYGNFNVSENKQGQTDVYFGGVRVVAQLENYNLAVGTSKNSGTLHCITLEGSDQEIKISDGQIKGLLESRGEVFGSEDSASNGYPNTRSDISIVIDISDTSSAYLDKIKNSVSSYISELNKRGLDTNFRLITYSQNNAITSMNYGEDSAALIADVRNLIVDAGASDNRFETVVDNIVDSNEYRKEANKYAVVFTGESPSGDENEADFSVINQKLVDASIKTIVVAPKIYKDSGLPAGEVKGWSEIADATGGTVFDIESEDFRAELTKISDFINMDVNKVISNTISGTNILPFAMQRLNSFTNVLFREINYIHSQGKTLGENSGSTQDFFVPIKGAYALKAGNVMLNPNLYDTDNIAASGLNGEGDNSIAVKMANLKNAKLFNDSKGVVSADEYYQMFIMEMGTMNAESARIALNQNKIVVTTDASRQSIMGVSLDEEMADVLKYKFAYNACSRAFNVIDQMMDMMINRMGTVGR